MEVKELDEDIGSGTHCDLIMMEDEHLIIPIREFNPYTQICLISILPRPMDDSYSRQKVHDLNHMLLLNSQHLGYHVADTFQFFAYNHVPLTVFFKRRSKSNRYSIHLSEYGSDWLGQILRDVVCDLAHKLGLNLSHRGP